MTTDSSRSEPTSSPAGWEREVVSRLASAGLDEQRRSRRWGIFFKFAFLAYLLGLLALYLPWSSWAPGVSQKHTALVEIQGIIAEDTDASADRIVAGLRAAFEDSNTAAVIVRINSPGGSPVQASYINDEMVRLRSEHPGKPLYAVITDMCASGGYYVAAAAEKIYANKSSVIGSIGVLMNGFGFVETMNKLGVERRLITAGEHKGFLDPFSPLRADEIAHIESVLEEIHAQFIDVVKSGRGERLKDNGSLFSGLVWTGEKSVELGLVDSLGSAGYVAREIVGVEEIVDFTPKRTTLERLAERVGVVLARALAPRIELL